MPPRVTRFRQLTPRQGERLQALRKVAHLLDSAFLVPGTSYRIGLDPLLGFIPGLGDLVSPLFAIGILLQARDLQIPKIVQVRMIFNVAIDSLFGAIPIVGDLFDFAWKANDRNLALLEHYAYEERPAHAGDWAFVSIMIAVVVGLAALPFVVAGYLISQVAALF